MESGAAEAEQIRSLDGGLQQPLAGQEIYAMKSSPDHGFSGYNFKSTQDMMVMDHADLAGVPLEQPVELVPIQVVPSQGLGAVGQGVVTMEGLQVPASYRMELGGAGAYPLHGTHSQEQQYGSQAGQQYVGKTGTENSLGQIHPTPIHMGIDVHGRHTKVLVQGDLQPGAQVHNSMRRLQRSLSVPAETEVILENSLGGTLGSGGISHQVLGSALQTGASSTIPETANGERLGGAGVSPSGKEGAKTRWKPNPVQLCLLEQHFNSGYTKATPELHAAVQGAGHASENQVTVWLKNRLSRCKRPPPKVKQNEGSKPQEEGSDNEGPWEDFSKVSTTVLEELSSILSTVDKEDIILLATAIRNANKICCCGVGREGLVMRALASSLHHLGLEAYSVGDTNMPQFGTDDLVLVSAGPSYYSSVSALALEASRARAKVIAFTAHKTADLPFADRAIRVPAQTLPPSMPVTNQNMSVGGAPLVSFLPEGKWSILQMGASFEMSLWLMFECVSIMLRKVCHVTPADMRSRHTNLE